MRVHDSSITSRFVPYRYSRPRAGTSMSNSQTSQTQASFLPARQNCIIRSNHVNAAERYGWARQFNSVFRDKR